MKRDENGGNGRCPSACKARPLGFTRPPRSRVAVWPLYLQTSVSGGCELAWGSPGPAATSLPWYQQFTDESVEAKVKRHPQGQRASRWQNWNAGLPVQSRPSSLYLPASLKRWLSWGPTAGSTESGDKWLGDWDTHRASDGESPVQLSCRVPLETAPPPDNAQTGLPPFHSQDALPQPHFAYLQR